MRRVHARQLVGPAMEAELVEVQDECLVKFFVSLIGIGIGYGYCFG